MTHQSNHFYDNKFFEQHEQGMIQSARMIVPILMQLIQPSSVIDIGCGRGAWLRAFLDNGVKAVKGLDGPYIDQSELLINPASFTPTDLRKPFDLNSSYDLAVCLETVEHLPRKMRRPLIHALTKASQLVLFSAAIPGQGGTYHINEQWPSYWQSLFAERGFKKLDPIRRHIWQDKRISWWYRQNIFLYASEEAVRRSLILQLEEKLAADLELEIIHIGILQRYTTIRGLLHEAPRIFWRTLKNKVGYGRKRD